MKVILIVDDKNELTSMFDRQEDKIVCIDNTCNIVDLATDLKPDLILLDLSSTEKSEIVTYGELKDSDITKNIPVIIITASTNHFDSMKIGLDMVIEKPFIREYLHEVIRTRFSNEQISRALDTASLAISKLKICQCEGLCSDDLIQSKLNL